MSFNHPGYGIYPIEDRHISSVGSLSSVSKKSMIGWWCPWCYANGVYHWIEPSKHSSRDLLSNICDVCNVYSNDHMEEVKVLMANK